jgi:hypothetical protein
VLLMNTAGRLHIDDQPMTELNELSLAFEELADAGRYG